MAQWFSVQGVTEQNRAERIAQATPSFIDRVQQWQRSTGVRVHLMHGEQDNVIPVRHSIEASERLAQLAGSVTLDLFPGLGHGIDERVLGRMSERLAQAMKSAVS